MKFTKHTVAAVLLFVAIVGASGCTDNAGARRTLENQGFTAIELTGYDFFACSDSDTYATGFKATTQVGQRVTGVVCSGITKGYTVRMH